MDHILLLRLVGLGVEAEGGGEGVVTRHTCTAAQATSSRASLPTDSGVAVRAGDPPLLVCTVSAPHAMRCTWPPQKLLLAAARLAGAGRLAGQPQGCKAHARAQGAFTIQQGGSRPCACSLRAGRTPPLMPLPPLAAPAGPAPRGVHMPPGVSPWRTCASTHGRCPRTGGGRFCRCGQSRGQAGRRGWGP